jgi:hypothetical protein
MLPMNALQGVEHHRGQLAQGVEGLGHVADRVRNDGRHGSRTGIPR